MRALPNLLLLAVLLPCAAPVYSQAQDGIDRNLLERRQREVQFGVSLYDEPTRATLSAPGAPRMPITLLPPEANPWGERRIPPASAAPAPAAVPRSNAPQDLQQLHDSQQRRQLNLQLRTRELPDAIRQQEAAKQQLIFERENRAQELGTEILRRSSEATGAR